MSSIGVSAAVSAPAPTVMPEKTAGSKTGKRIRALADTIKVIPVSTGIEWAVTLTLEGNANGLIIAIRFFLFLRFRRAGLNFL